jgi:hypothetical protein
MTGRQLCVIQDCFVPGQHETDCDRNCTGCLPGLAMDGALICNHHHRAGVRDLQQIPALYDDLSAVLVRRSNMLGTYITGTPESVGLNLDQNVMDAKEYMLGRLFELAAYICEERGVHAPETLDARTLAAFLTRHADWMSADRVLAGKWGRQVANIRSEARRYAYPSRRTSTRIGDCPTCGEPLRHDPSDYAGDLVTCRGCKQTATVDGWQQALIGQAALDAQAVAALMSSRYNRTVLPSTVRAWATKGIIRRLSEGDATVYDVAEVRAYCDTIWQPIGA